MLTLLCKSSDQNMTSINTPSPLVAGATTNSSNAWKAFTGTNSDFWDSNEDPGVTPQNLALDLGAGNALIVNRYGLQKGSPGYEFKSWTFHASNLDNPDIDDDGDWTEALDTQTGASDPGGNWLWRSFVNTTAYRHYKIRFTEGTTAHVRVARLALIQSQEESAPGSLIKSLGTLSSGAAGSSGWTRLEISESNRYQFQRGKAVWIVERGETSKDYSVSKQRVNTVKGCMFPDEMICSKESLDGGTNWTVSLKDDRFALWNIILNSAIDHVPQLMYSRFSGKRISLNGSLHEIPEEAIFLDCSSLDVVGQGDTPYNIFIYENSGTLTLEASLSAVAHTDGIEHKYGDASHRFVGQMAPQEIQSGVQGPVDAPDMRLVANRYNTPSRTLMKDCPFASNVWFNHSPQSTQKWHNSSAFDLMFLVLGQAHVQITAMGAYRGSALTYDGIVLDCINNLPNSSSRAVNTSSSEQLQTNVGPGVHTVYPIITNDHSSALAVYYNRADTGATYRATIGGTIIGA